jgi:type IV secretory pathway VirJ component
MRVLSAVMLALVLAATAPLARAETISGGHYGPVEIARPTGKLNGIVFLFSRLSGWTESDRQAADRLAEHDLLVVGVDTARYADNLAKTSHGCQLLVGDVEIVSHQLQREMQSDTYFTPILAGIGEGGTLAEKVLSIAASNTIAGAISLDPKAELDARFNPCPPDPTILHDAGLPGFWNIGTTADLPAVMSDLAAALTHDGATVETRHFAGDATEDAMLLALSEPHLGPQAPDEQDVSDLPLVELPAARPSKMLAIIISGDGGWRDLDQTLGRSLQNAGVSVVGIDALRYFWSAKTPDETARDVGRVIRAYRTRWNASSTALIGYSFGADVLPVVYNRLPDELRRHVNLIALLGLTSAADFEIRVGGWLGLPPSAEALPVAVELAKVPAPLMQCFYGEDESDTLCPSLQERRVAVIRTSGSHHFGRDYDRLAHVILNGWHRRLIGG